MHNKQSKNTNARLIATSVASAFAWDFVLWGVGICSFWSKGLYEELFYSSSSVIIIFLTFIKFKNDGFGSLINVNGMALLLFYGACFKKIIFLKRSSNCLAGSLIFIFNNPSDS